MEREGSNFADVGFAQEVRNPGSQPPYWAGTPEYMAPEHLDGHPCIYSDLHAFAAMVYEWLSGGQRPTSNPKPISGIPRGINDVVLKALDNDPNKRYRGVKAFANSFRDAYVKERDIQVDEYYKSGEGHIRAGQYKEARDDFTRVIALNEGYSGAFAYRGSAYLGLRDFNQALADLNHALEMDEKNIYARAHRGVVHRKMGRYKEAREDFTQALALDSSQTWIVEELKNLRQLMRR